MTESVDHERYSSHSVTCRDDLKEIYACSQQNVAKLSRGDLEDLYYQLHDENIEIKKKFNNLDNKYKIMAARVMRLSRDHKCIDTIGREEDQRQLKQLKQNETALRAKLTLLKEQLTSHTRLHSAAFSKMQRPRSHHCSHSCHSGRGSCAGDNDLDSSCPENQNQNKINQGSSSANRSGQHHDRSLSPKTNINHVKINSSGIEEVASLQEQIISLQNDMVIANERSQSRILELETELDKTISQVTSDKVELIKARRINKQQEAALVSLQQDNQLLQRELDRCKAALTLAAQDQDELCSTLMRERQRSSNFQQEIIKLSQNCSSIRELEEQLKDAKKENIVLKEHTNQLLKIKSGPNGSKEDSDEKRQNVSDLNKSDKISIFEEESTATQLKLQNLIAQKSKLTQELSEVQTEVSGLQKIILDATRERTKLREELAKLQKECSELQKELVEPSEEKTRLTQQLREVQKQRDQLILELQRSQIDIHHQKQDRKSIIEDSSKTTSYITEKPDKTDVTDSGTSPSPGFSCTLPTTLLLSPQPPRLPYHSLSSAQPGTLRPDARLALLEQTAIKPFSSTVLGALDSQGSLQERFWELCAPSDPTSLHLSSSASVEVGANSGKLPPATQDHQPKNSLASTSKIAKQSPHHEAGTQWELTKCRDLLRVQFNLNSIYKKEIASLNNMVQSLTTGAHHLEKTEN